MIYFCVAVFAFFLLFRASMHLIRNLQKVQFCNFVRPCQKTQDNIIKKAAAEKEPSTLEKDKADQNIISAIQSCLF